MEVWVFSRLEMELEGETSELLDGRNIVVFMSGSFMEDSCSEKYARGTNAVLSLTSISFTSDL